VSLFREEDRMLIAGDAFVTTKQESAISALTYSPEMHGPPAYFTPDWSASRKSVERLAALEPERVVTGHGPMLSGPQMRRDLNRLAREFERLAVPAHGRYVGRPATADARGVVSVPPPVPDPLPKILLAVGLGLLLTTALRRSARSG
jgi:glyoxylase-like metal-dependent hydrolase (beta-lactamase superfamily II)